MPATTQSNTSTMVPLAGSASPQSEGYSTPWSQMVQVQVDGERFLVHKHVLNQIPFFKACLNAPMEESASGIVKLPEDYAHVFRRIIHFAYHREIHPDLDLLKTARKVGSDHTFEDIASKKLTPMISLYIAAKKFGLEPLQNMAIDQIRPSLQFISFGPEHMIQLDARLDASDPLWKLVLHDFTVQIKLNGWDSWKGDQDQYNIYNDWIGMDFDKMEKVTKAIDYYRDYPAPWKKWYPCLYHTHVDTKRCPNQC